jgi:hypothetical protein
MFGKSKNSIEREIASLKQKRDAYSDKHAAAKAETAARLAKQFAFPLTEAAMDDAARRAIDRSVFEAMVEEESLAKKVDQLDGEIAIATQRLNEEHAKQDREAEAAKRKGQLAYLADTLPAFLAAARKLSEAIAPVAAPLPFCDGAANAVTALAKEIESMTGNVMTQAQSAIAVVEAPPAPTPPPAQPVRREYKDSGSFYRGRGVDWNPSDARQAQPHEPNLIQLKEEQSHGSR